MDSLRPTYVMMGSHAQASQVASQYKLLPSISADGSIVFNMFNHTAIAMFTVPGGHLTAADWGRMLAGPAVITSGKMFVMARPVERAVCVCVAAGEEGAWRQMIVLCVSKADFVAAVNFAAGAANQRAQAYVAPGDTALAQHRGSLPEWVLRTIVRGVGVMDWALQLGARAARAVFGM